MTARESQLLAALRSIRTAAADAVEQDSAGAACYTLLRDTLATIARVSAAHIAEMAALDEKSTRPAARKTA